MTKLAAVPSAGKAGRFPTTLRFRAANGAVVSVTVRLPVAADETGRAREVAREAIAQVAAAQSAGVHSGPAVEPDDCDAVYWSWALPAGWPQSDR